jgi:hypothetical protein
MGGDVRRMSVASTLIRQARPRHALATVPHVSTRIRITSDSLHIDGKIRAHSCSEHFARGAGMLG